MKFPQKAQNHGMTLFEVLLVIACIAILAALLLPALAAAKVKRARINCVSNLNQIALALKAWEGDHYDKFPVQFAATNDLELKRLAEGRSVWPWQVCSNELNSTKIFVCPEDTLHFPATRFESLTGSNISYFLNLDISDVYPNMIMAGDDNLLLNDHPVQSRIMVPTARDMVKWDRTRHNGCGNVSMADGSVQQWTSTMLANAITNSAATNRWIIP
ncbi:MAG TPA: prepilin-type N-terminal cleavage/methylation domain-containing protein [Verrucomicrobiae bacterium]|nr:prepilin-type N-terminal cleavage/methylation domain-containing protein [Verrucomicrobiae bacterium]